MLKGLSIASLIYTILPWRVYYGFSKDIKDQRVYLQENEMSIWDDQ
jgi:hypothetical protein